MRPRRSLQLFEQCLVLLAATLPWPGPVHATEPAAAAWAGNPALQPRGASAAAATWKDPTTGMELVFVKGGCFQMGDVFHDGVSGTGESTDEQPVHEVCLDDFFIGRYEVTQGQWKTAMGNNPSAERTSGANCVADDCPVDLVTREEVQEFIDRLNREPGAGTYRLPTEAEWEYAARSGGKAERFSGGNDVESVSWNMINTGYFLMPQIDPPWVHPVGRRAPNGLGLYDMSGNVYEYVSDWYDATYYSRSPRDNPKGPATGQVRVKRGGCAHGNTGNQRTSRRTQDDQRDDLLGLRLLRIP